MPAARPAAGRGGKTKTSKAKPASTRATSRADRLHAARAAGASGAPAPAWIDDAELLGAYDEGASSLGDSWAGDTDSAGSGTGGNNGPKAPSGDADGFTPPAEPSTPEPMQQFGSGSGGQRKVGPFQPKGTAGDAAGALLGILAAAFLQNVLSGRWTDWLRAKFLNKVKTPTVTKTIPGGGGATGQYQGNNLQSGPTPPVAGPGGSMTLPGPSA